MIGFGPFEPDKFGLDSSLSSQAKNVYPAPDSYKPMPSLEAYGSATLPTACKGLWFARSASGGWMIFCATTTKIYKYVSGAWVDYSRLAGGAYNCPAEDKWSGTQFGSQLILVNINDDPQVLDVDSGAANFAALAGSPPKARLVRGVGDFVFLAGTSTDQREIAWSGINDAEEWSSITALSDVQTFPTGGRVMGIGGGDGKDDAPGFILQEMAVRRFMFQPGSEFVFSFSEIEGAKGCVAPFGSDTRGGTMFYRGEDGFYSIGPNGLNPIGATRVNEFWRANTDAARVYQEICVADPYNPRVFWAAYSTSASTQYDILICYDWQLDRWSWSNEAATIWGALATPGTGLDSLDSFGTLDSLLLSLDSTVWQGAKPTFGAVTSTGGLTFLSGPNLEAIVTTSEGQPGSGQVAFVPEIRPVADTTNVTVRVGYRNRLGDAVTWTEPASVNAIGTCDTRLSARFVRAELTIPAGTSWSHVAGVEPVAVPDGVR